LQGEKIKIRLADMLPKILFLKKCARSARKFVIFKLIWPKLRYILVLRLASKNVIPGQIRA
jgi:hypothetical protein